MMEDINDVRTYSTVPKPNLGIWEGFLGPTIFKF